MTETQTQERSREKIIRLLEEGDYKVVNDSISEPLSKHDACEVGTIDNDKVVIVYDGYPIQAIHCNELKRYCSSQGVLRTERARDQEALQRLRGYAETLAEIVRRISG